MEVRGGGIVLSQSLDTVNSKMGETIIELSLLLHLKRFPGDQPLSVSSARWTSRGFSFRPGTITSTRQPKTRSDSGAWAC